MLELRQALGAAAALQQRVAEVEGGIASGGAPDGRLPHSLAGERQRAPIRVRADQSKRGVVERPAVVALEQELVEVGARCVDDSWRRRRRSGRRVDERPDPERRGGTERGPDQQECERDGEPPPAGAKLL